MLHVALLAIMQHHLPFAILDNHSEIEYSIHLGCAPNKQSIQQLTTVSRNMKYKQKKKSQAKRTRHIITKSNCGLLSVVGSLVRLVKFRASRNFSNKTNWTSFPLLSALDNYPSRPKDGGEPALQCLVEWLPSMLPTEPLWMGYQL